MRGDGRATAWKRRRAGELCAALLLPPATRERARKAERIDVVSYAAADVAWAAAAATLAAPLAVFPAAAGPALSALSGSEVLR